MANRLRNVLAVVVLLLLTSALCPVAHAGGGQRPGLIAEFWDFAGKELADFPAITPDMEPSMSQVDAQIDLPGASTPFDGTRLITHFAARWSGRLTVAKAGHYTIYCESDDGSRVFIDDQQVVDNPGLHAMAEKAGEVDLAAGDHTIRVEFFENEGPCGIRLSWASTGIDKQIIPAEAFSHNPGDARGAIRTGTTIAVDDSVVELEAPAPATKPQAAKPAAGAVIVPAAGAGTKPTPAAAGH